MKSQRSREIMVRLFKLKAGANKDQRKTSWRPAEKGHSKFEELATSAAKCEMHISSFIELYEKV